MSGITAVYPEDPLTPAHVALMDWKGHGPARILCYAVPDTEIDRTDFISRVRAKIHVDNFRRQPDGNGHHGMYVLRKSDKPEREPLFVPSIAALRTIQILAGLEDGQLDPNPVRYQKRLASLTVSAIKQVSGEPFVFKDRTGNEVPVPAYSLKGRDVDVVFSFYTLTLTEKPLRVQGTARLLEMQLLD